MAIGCLKTTYFGKSLSLAIARLDTSLSPSITFAKVRAHRFTWRDISHVLNALLALFWFAIMTSPPAPWKWFIPVLWIAALIVPATCQFVYNATPILVYVLSFYSNRFIPENYRPSISVGLLPTLESVFFGANISDILTRYTHPLLDVLAWIPYGVGHFTLPFVLAFCLWIFKGKRTLVLFSRAFGYMNLAGVLIQIAFPCSAPWYEVIYGLMPAHYGMRGSPGGLSRIDALLGVPFYNGAFGGSPLVFGAFPSLHSGSATMEALFVSHFFPHLKKPVWIYAGILYWATMYLTHHYLIDVVGGACMSTLFFYVFLPNELKGERGGLERPANFPTSMLPPGARIAGANAASLGSARGHVSTPSTARRNKYARHDVEMPNAEDFELGQMSDEEQDITYRSPAAHGGVSRFLEQQERGKPQGHKHTASIASLIRADERGSDEGWSPVRGSFSRGRE